MDSEKKRIRLIIRQVHPDLFLNNPYERQCNSESLKNLNTYVDELSKGRVPRPTRLEFYVRENSQLRRLEAQLSASGSLSPLFFAFGLVSADEMRAADNQSLASDTNMLAWLQDQVQEAVRTAEKHDIFKWHIRRLKSSLEEKFQLAAVQVGAEYAVSLLEQERQVEALKVLESGLQVVAMERGPQAFEGLTVQLYHPSSCPQEVQSFVDSSGTFNMKTTYMKPFVGDDGALHIVADRETINEQLRGLDLPRARTLTQVSFFWLKRVRDLTPAVTQLLGVRSVWCDTKTEHNSQKFVIWAGYLLEKKDEVSSMLQGRKFSFSIIVHADPHGPLINFHQSSPILNVRSDCPPSHLLEFLVSEGGVQASAAATEVHSSRQREEALLERVRQTFEAKCVIKICMNDKVREGAMRLLEHSDSIKQAVDLRGACIALDDCYEVWDSGFISIPYNFKIQELSSMVRMLQAGGRPAAGDAANGGNGAASSGAASTSGQKGNGATAGAASGARTGTPAAARAGAGSPEPSRPAPASAWPPTPSPSRPGGVANGAVVSGVHGASAAGPTLVPKAAAASRSGRHSPALVRQSVVVTRHTPQPHRVTPQPRVGPTGRPDGAPRPAAGKRPGTVRPAYAPRTAVPPQAAVRPAGSVGRAVMRLL